MRQVLAPAWSAFEPAESVFGLPQEYSVLPAEPKGLEAFAAAADFADEAAERRSTQLSEHPSSARPEVRLEEYSAKQEPRSEPADLPRCGF